jgi:hypothetical protein
MHSSNLVFPFLLQGGLLMFINYHHVHQIPLPMIEDQGQKQALVLYPLDSPSPINTIPNPLIMQEEVLCDKQNDLVYFDVGEYLVAFDSEIGTQDAGLSTQHV